MTQLSELVDIARDRLDALPIDRAPLRRAGLLTLALIALVVGMPLLMPTRPVPDSSIERQSLQENPETNSARPAKSGGSAGRIIALLLLAGVGAYAFSQRRRTSSADASTNTLEILESVVLGPGQSLRLVACGDEVLLLSVGADGARLLRNWPRGSFDRNELNLAEAFHPDPLDAPHEMPVPVEDADAVEHDFGPGRGELFPRADRAPIDVSLLESPAGATSFASVLRQFQVHDA